MSVEMILKKKGGNVFSVRPEHSLMDTCTLMAHKNVGVAVVCDAKGKVMGLVSEGDVVKGIAAYGKSAHEMPVRNFMASPPITCRLGDSAKDVLRTMNDRRIRHLPVMDDGTLVGIVSIGDVVNYRLLQSQEEVGVLRDFAVIR
jgi:CBS domain-containing protein